LVYFAFERCWDPIIRFLLPQDFLKISFFGLLSFCKVLGSYYWFLLVFLIREVTLFQPFSLLNGEGIYFTSILDFPKREGSSSVRSKLISEQSFFIPFQF